MLAQPAWFVRLPHILGELAALPPPVVARATVERLFVLRRRRAIELLHRFGGYQAGRTFLLDRRRLIEELERIHHSPELICERRRRERLSESLDRLRQHRAASRVTIPVEPPLRSPQRADLPVGVSLTATCLTVDFHGPEDLLAKLFGLAQTIAADYERFRQRLSTRVPLDEAEER